GVRQRDVRAQAQARPDQCRTPGHRRRASAPRRPGEIQEVVRARTLGRHEAAHRARPLARPGPAGAADGRAVRRARCHHARASVPGSATDLPRAEKDHHLRHAQRARSRMPRRPRVHPVAEPGPHSRGIPHLTATTARHQQSGAGRHRAAHYAGVEVLSGRLARRRSMKRAVVVIVFFAALVGIWQVATMSGRWSPVLLPPPRAVGEYLWAALSDGTLVDAAMVTLRRLLIGYAIGLAIGLPLGLAVSTSQYLEDTVGALALGLQTLPSVCWVPLALLWFGQTEAAMLFVVVMGTVWSVVLATSAGARTIPPIYARAARTMGSEGLDKWTRVILPASLPFVVSGMKQGWDFAWRSLMAAEIFVTILTGFGLGHLLQYGRELSAMDQVIGVMVAIVLIGLIADKLLFSPWERFVHRRWGTGLI